MFIKTDIHEIHQRSLRTLKGAGNPTENVSDRKGIKREIGHTETCVKSPNLWKLKEPFPKFHRDVKGEGTNGKLRKWSDSEDIARLDHRAS